MAFRWATGTDAALTRVHWAKPKEPVNTVCIKTYGCQMNVEDSRRLEHALVGGGFTIVDAPEKSFLVILNTCHIRHKAAEKVYSELGKLVALRSGTGKPGLLAVAGCVAQAHGEEIIRRQPGVDLVIGPGSLHRICALIEQVCCTGKPAIALDLAAEDKFAQTFAPSPGASAYLTVQEGCDKFCTFCVVPYTRGAEISRPVSAILDDAGSLVAGGAREITVLGQNVTAFHGSGPDGQPWTLARLIAAIASIDGVDRLFYTTSHPRDIDNDIIDAHASIEALAPCLHLPVQSGSDDMLRAMNRGHTAADYLDIIRRLRSARPDIAISSDFIVGFPGETDADFEATLSLVETVGFASAYCFAYSARPGTPAADMTDQLDPRLAKERLTRLQQAVSRSALSFNLSLVGRTMPVVLSSRARHRGQFRGRSPYGKAVNVVAGSDDLGVQLAVEIIGATGHSLTGRVCSH